MAMPRPSGRALKIAKKVIPGLNRNDPIKAASKSRRVPNDKVEMAIVQINENRGRLK